MSRSVKLPGIGTIEVPNAKTASYLRGLHRRACSGDPEAQYDIAVNYEEGGFFPVSRRKAHTWYCAAWARGHVPALTGVAAAYRTGDVVSRDLAAAIRLYAIGVRLGDAGAAGELGQCYVAGRGVKRDVARGVKLLRRASRGGIGKAAYALSELYRVRRDPALRSRWLRVADRLDHPPAAFELAHACEKSPGRALFWMKRAARFADPAAYRELAWYCENGIGTQPNVRLATYWYECGARWGDAVSAFNLGLIHFRKKMKPTRVAMKWFALAAARGHARAAAYCRARELEHIARFVS